MAHKEKKPSTETTWAISGPGKTEGSGGGEEEKEKGKKEERREITMLG